MGSDKAAQVMAGMLSQYPIDVILAANDNMALGPSAVGMARTEKKSL